MTELEKLKNSLALLENDLEGIDRRIAGTEAKMNEAETKEEREAYQILIDGYLEIRAKIQEEFATIRELIETLEE